MERAPVAVGRDVDAYSLILGAGLKRGESQAFELLIHARAHGGKVIPPVFDWETSRRVDELTLRVAFTADVPGAVTFQLLDHTGYAHGETAVPIDPISREARIVVAHPKPRLIFRLVWSWPGDPLE